MPTYEYRCENDHTFEVMQRMSDDPVQMCQECGAPVQRVFHPVAVHFKGKGFYNTDYGTKKRQRELKDSAESGANDYADKQKDKKDAKDAKDSKSSSSSSSSSDGGSSSGSPKPKKDSSATAS
jgi:putative FmdB family regulatory protein